MPILHSSSSFREFHHTIQGFTREDHKEGMNKDDDGEGLGPRKVLRGGIPKVNFAETLSLFGDKCPHNGSENDPMAPRTTAE